MAQPLWQRWPLPNVHCPLLPVVQKGKGRPLNTAHKVVCRADHTATGRVQGFFVQNETSVVLMAQPAHRNLESLVKVGSMESIWGDGKGCRDRAQLH